MFFTALTLVITPFLSGQTEISDREVDRLWRIEWRRFENNFARVGEQYYCFPSFEPGKYATHAETEEELMQQTAYEVQYQTLKNGQQTMLIVKPLADIQAKIALLAEPKAGEYGFINSGNVLEIVDEDTVILNQVWLLNVDQVLAEKKAAAPDGDAVRSVLSIEDRRDDDIRGAFVAKLYEARDYGFEFRIEAIQLQKEPEFARKRWVVHGIDTGAMTVGNRFPDKPEERLHLAIAEAGDEEIVTTTVETLGKDLSELEMLNALEDLGVTKQDFIRILREEKMKDRDKYQRTTLERVFLLSRKPEE